LTFSFDLQNVFSGIAQAQLDEFEKRLTAVHTRGLENVESPEVEEGGSAENVSHTPQPARGRARSTRGKSYCKHGA
jgi:hypothetical protein